MRTLSIEKNVSADHVPDLLSNIHSHQMGCRPTRYCLSRPIVATAAASPGLQQALSTSYSLICFVVNSAILLPSRHARYQSMVHSIAVSILSRGYHPISIPALLASSRRVWSSCAPSSWSRIQEAPLPHISAVLFAMRATGQLSSFAGPKLYAEAKPASWAYNFGPANDDSW